MERNAGQEEQILDALTSFAADQGFILPTPEAESTVVNIRQSTASLNIVLSENEETTSALWDRIRTMIGKELLASLDTILPGQNQQEYEVHLAEVWCFHCHYQLFDWLCIEQPTIICWNYHYPHYHNSPDIFYIGLKNDLFYQLIGNELLKIWVV